jgi:diguanylate cyclase (GGDEF)-like protein
MIILIVALLLLQRRNPRIAMGSWLVALGLIFLSKLSWYVTWFNTPYYAAVHTFRLTVDLLVGMVLLLFTGRRLSRLSLRLPVLLWIGAPFIVVEILYGMEVAQPGPYCVCAAAGAVISVGVAAKLRRGVATAVAQVMVWLAIAGFSVSGNFRASAYVGLAAVYAAAAVHIWFRLRKGSIGRLGITASLGTWSCTFLTHPWMLAVPRYRAFSEEVWNMQKFFISIAMLIFLLEEEIRQNTKLALHDQLTGLPNRRLMEERLLAAIGQGVASVLLIDLDSFKKINDTFGHLAGDEVLRETALRLKTALHGDETLARIGGDEFLIVSMRDPTLLMAAIALPLSKPFVLEGGVEVDVGLSIGSSIYPADARGATGTEAIRHLLRAADRHMYAQKPLADRDALTRRPDRPATI